MTVLPRTQPHNAQSAEPVSGCVELRWRVLERRPDNRCVAVDLVATAEFDGTITVDFAGNGLEQQTVTLATTFDQVESPDRQTVLAWCTDDACPVLRVLSHETDGILACRSDIPERLGLPAGTYDLQESRLVTSAPSID